ncbi:MAG: histidine kinase, partial [Lewinella sp.]|nr:histidine kinase [Lewinella sp.]
MFLADRIEHYLLAGTRQPPPRQLEMRQLQSDGPVAEVTPGEGGPRKGPQGPIDPRFFITFIIYSAVLLAGTMLESVQLYNQQAYLVSQARNEQLQTELKFLKSQINPHFLFNALNNVYTLSLIGSEQTPEVVMKLSEMLRYMLYESNQERVSLGQEVQYIQNYVSLQQLKDDLPLAVETRLDVTHPEMRIAPMILIPFVENAFKHSKIEDTEHGWIRIELREEAQALTFVVRNSRSAATFTKDATGGIGLANVRRRLELEYPGRHQLLIDEEEEQFAIVLTIQSL